MGSKRVGLARTQALIENLQRVLKLGTTQITCKKVTATNGMVIDADGLNVGAGGVTVEGGELQATASSIHARGYNASNKTPSLIEKWPAATADLGSGSKTYTIAQILTGIILCDPTADAAHTLPTAADAVAGVTNVAVGDCIDFVVINTGTAGQDEIITVAANASGGTLVGSGTILAPHETQSNHNSGSAQFRIRFTNVSSSSEAYVVYRIA